MLSRKSQICVIAVVAVLLAALIGLSLAITSTQDTVTASPHRMPIYISEVMTSNTLYPNEDGLLCDYIEIYHSGDSAIDLSGYQVTDAGGSASFVFPEGTVLQPGDIRIIYCSQAASGGSYAPFSLSRMGGETLYLVSPRSGAIADTVELPALGENEVLLIDEAGIASRSYEASPGTLAPEGAPNRSHANADLSCLILNEVMTSNASYGDVHGLFCDWIEVKNMGEAVLELSGYSLSDDPDSAGFSFPEGLSLLPGECTVLYCSGSHEAGYAPFKLSSAGGETLYLRDSMGRVLDHVTTVPLSRDESYALQNGFWEISNPATPGYDNTEEGYDLYFREAGTGWGDIVISEVMTGNGATLYTEYGFADWIELHNVSDTYYTLAGWYLSDDPTDPYACRLPQLELAPGAFCVLPCTKDAKAGDLALPFGLSSAGETLTLTNARGVTVDTFTVPALTQDRSAILFEGDILLSDAPTPGMENSEQSYDALLTAGREPAGSLAIWEVMPANTSLLAQTDGNCYDWVELKNIGTEPIDLSCYTLTDDPEVPDRFVFSEKTLAPGKYVTVILSGDPDLSSKNYPHADFALNAEQDRLYLFRDGELEDYVLVQGESFEFSLGLGESGETFGFSVMKPSPNKPNTQGYTLSCALSASVAEGVWVQDVPVTVTLTPEVAGAPIYYTLDGSDPTAEDHLYTEPVTVTDTTLLRAAAVQDARLPGEIYTSFFLFGEEHAIPIVNLTTDPMNLWSNRGIYKSTHDIKGIEKPAHIAFTAPEGQFALDCTIGMRGATSLLAQPKKSFTVRFKDSMDGQLHYDIFGDGKIVDYDSIVLRADQESTYSSYLHDSLYGHIASTDYNGPMMAMNSRHIALYLNGEYWGIYSIREHVSEEYYAAHRQFPEDSVSMIKYYVTKDESTLYQAYLMAKGGTLTDEEYAQVCEWLDLESFADWIIFQAYTSNFDINGNMRYLHSTVDDKWRCVLVDVDLGMFTTKTFPSVTEAFNNGQIPRALLRRPEFKKILIERMQYLMSGPLSDENVIANTHELAAILRPEIPREKDRWGGYPAQWEAMVSAIVEFADGRSRTMIDSLGAAIGMTPQEREEHFGEILS